ncbi:hypothetical protein [Nocardioides sp. Kera G14]|uniref:nucleotide-binding protein n=1 Tax=Nocardioides sp. Kera G14 TaxID=2884264 RepID=UPI001D12F6E8|nr:hypothetical protein [Nocardioides sp. Kera G14]UDY22824.1 hypothetical protein LH076_12195 [Nocardioides sp. Kera G14]
MARHTVLVVAAGAMWESDALALLDRSPELVLLKRCVDVDDLLGTIAAGQAEIALVGIDTPGLDSDAAARAADAGVRLVAVLPQGHEAAASRASQIGIALTVEDSDLAQLPRLLAERPAPMARHAPVEPVPAEEVEAATPGRVITVWGTGGAPGRSTVAAGLAALLARRGTTVTLVDADPAGGTLGQQLGVLDEVSGLLAVSRLATAGRLEEHWPSAARAVSDRMVVVTGLPRATRWREVPAGVLTALASSAAREGWVVIDAGAGLEGDGDRLTMEALEVADDVLVVATAEPIGLGRLARALVDLADQVAKPARVLVNRQRRSLGASDDEVAGLVQQTSHPLAIHLLPEDRVAVDKALLAATAVTEGAPDSALARALGQVLDALAPELVGRTRPRRGRRRLSS